MRFNIVPAITVGTVIKRDELLVAEAPRSMGLTDTVVVSVGGNAEGVVSGTELRAALLSTVHPGGVVLAPIGAHRWGMRLDPEQRCSTIAHLDAMGTRAPVYWLYRRGAAGPVRLTRWARVGHVSREALLRQTGLEPESMTKAALARALTSRVRTGLPRELDVVPTGPGRDTVKVEAPSPGWLDIEPGGLKRSDRLPTHRVDDLGPWPGVTACRPR